MNFTSSDIADLEAKGSELLPLATTKKSYTLPWPPSVNDMYSVVRGRKILSKEARRFKAGAKSMRIGATPFTGPVEVQMNFFRPNKRTDLTNHFKAPEDFLAGIAYVNDRQVCKFSAERFEDPERPRVEVFVREVAHA